MPAKQQSKKQAPAPTKQRTSQQQEALRARRRAARQRRSMRKQQGISAPVPTPSKGKAKDSMAKRTEWNNLVAIAQAVLAPRDVPALRWPMKMRRATDVRHFASSGVLGTGIAEATTDREYPAVGDISIPVDDRAFVFMQCPQIPLLCTAQIQSNMFLKHQLYDSIMDASNVTGIDALMVTVPGTTTAAFYEQHVVDKTIEIVPGASFKTGTMKVGVDPAASADAPRATTLQAGESDGFGFYSPKKDRYYHLWTGGDLIVRVANGSTFTFLGADGQLPIGTMHDYPATVITGLVLMRYDGEDSPDCAVLPNHIVHTYDHTTNSVDLPAWNGVTSVISTPEEQHASGVTMVVQFELFHNNYAAAYLRIRPQAIGFYYLRVVYTMVTKPSQHLDLEYSGFTLAYSVCTQYVEKHLVWRPESMDAVKDHSFITERYRTNALALLITNFSGKDDDGGQVQAAIFEGGLHVPTYSDFKRISCEKLNGYDGSADKGLYTWMMPHSVDWVDGQYTTYSTSYGTYTAQKTPYCNIDKILSTSVIRFTSGRNVYPLLMEGNATPGTNNATVGSYNPPLRWRVDMHIEFITDDVMAKLGLSVATSADLENAMTTLCDVPHFTENWTHLHELWRQMKRAAMVVVQAGTQAAKAAAQRELIAMVGAMML